jgi:tetratricopeptide (TPR) repeat protein
MPNRQRLRVILRCLSSVLTLCALPSAATPKDAWVEVRSPNFTVISNAGEKEARKVADQFEQFREVFHVTFPKWRLDLGKPLIIFAVKNEDSLKSLLPGYWEQKGRIHPQGIYVPGEDRHFVAVQTNVETENPYQIVYHEYTHAIINLNFRGLPVWLNEGLAEFYANSMILDKEVEVGKASPYHLQELQQEQLIPIDQLFAADEHSPFYNEANHASMFYAESWAIVHYLMLDPEARKQQLVNTYIKDLDTSGNSLEAAEKTFGDLKKFGAVMQSYARQRSFYVLKVSTAIHGDAKSYASRPLPDAELDAQRALFYAHMQRSKEGIAAADQALKEDPHLPLAHEAQGFLFYSQGELLQAKSEFIRAIELNTTDYFAYYFAAEAELRSGAPQEEDVPKVVANLEKAIQLNPQFAPAYAALASVYSTEEETHEKALGPGLKATQLEPGNLFYATNYGYVLANLGKTAEAKELALRIQHAAKTPTDVANATQLLAVVARREEYDKRVEEMKRQASEQQSSTVVVHSQITVGEAAGANAVSAPTTNPGGTTKPANANANEDNEYAVEAFISAADCGKGPGKVTVSLGKTVMNFRFQDFTDVQVVSLAKGDSGQAPACQNWKGRRARIYFFKVKDKEFAGDLSTIQFF